MAFDNNLKKSISDYVTKHLKINNYKDLLSFLDNKILREEIEKELYSIRYVYKILEGLQVKDDLQIMQAKIQVLIYSSIYEAIIDYLLFEKFRNNEKVQKLMKKISFKRIDLPKKCDECKEHDGKEIFFMFKKMIRENKEK